MKTYKKITVVTISLLWLFILAGFASGEEIVMGIDEVTIIQDSDSDIHHILLKPALPVPDTNIMINNANLSLLVSPISNDTTFISIRFYTITTDWDEGDVSWDSPWTEPGGDYDESHYAEFTITLPEEQDVQFDLTDICQRWADGRLSYHGLLLKISESSHHNITIQNNDGSLGTISISYSPLLEE